ncbi:diadenylate cyclase CdaA [uncultured Sunxiuqinia sp.]|uniref:diadenylate cyclase CdaA n=1 Tax=uncultured Sunxiuqinia sp. TaxID=1573825 RepID=UPI00198E3A3A|nr:TIGR00159 family protein [Sunxiuqinia sp.]|tara:strand:- start:11551 stop:12348 length:798 start_codon:yes stop_codon:yes gene_type:complete
MSLFITLRFLDVLDILLVAFLLYQLYLLIKGTVAFNIFIGLFLVYLFWLLVRALNMELLGSFMGQFIGVGILALIVVFQPEIRRFLLLIGSNPQVNRFLSIEQLFTSGKAKSASGQHLKMISRACENMAKTKTGALIVIAQNSELKEYVRTGEKINARISDALLETIFSKNTPLHDGAVIINRNKIAAARCIMPLTNKEDLNPLLGLRHRAAVGITENTDAFAIVVSEETGNISIAELGKLMQNISVIDLSNALENIIIDIDDVD